jgi:hypothetical protein
LTIASAGEGTLAARIARLSIEDAGPSLAFELRIPILLDDVPATLSTKLLHAQARSWRGLIGRSYRFDQSTRRYGKSDGQTYALDDVFADVRTTSSFHDTFVTRVDFGAAEHGLLDVTITGTVRVDEHPTPFTVEARLRIGGVVVERGQDAATAAALLDMNDYLPARISEGLVSFEPQL